jgi:hypothetical protein
MIGLLLLAGELVQGARSCRAVVPASRRNVLSEKVRDCGTRPPTPEVSILPPKADNAQGLPTR